MYKRGGELIEIIYGVTCGICDLRTKRIPNILHLLLILYMLYQYKFIGVIYTIIICIILSPLFFIGFVGSADIKMIACIAGYCGLANSYNILLISLFLASVYSIVKMIISRNFLSRFKYMINYFRRLSYGICMKYEKSSEAQIRLGIFFALGLVIWKVMYE